MNKAVVQFLIEFIAIQTTTLQNIVLKIENINPTDEDRTNSLAYLIHNYYSCTEDALKEILKIFDGKTLSHGENFYKDILIHAKIELKNIRPKLLGNETYKMLEEILRFRHVFRHTYNYILNPVRAKENKILVLENHPLLMSEFKTFTLFLENSIT